MLRCMGVVIALCSLMACGPTQSRECKRMLERMEGCAQLPSTSRTLIEQMGYEEGGACWEDADYAEVCTQACIRTMADWDRDGICP